MAPPSPLSSPIFAVNPPILKTSSREGSAMPEMPDCVGDKCTVVVFDVTVTTQTYDQVDDVSKAVTKQTIVPKNLKDGFEAAVKALFPDTENGCCEGEGEDCECTCRRTAKVA